MKININDDVTVILTEYGAEYLNKYMDELVKGTNISYTRYGANKEYKFHLWDLMHMFGPEMMMHKTQMVFKDNCIFLDEKQQ